MSEPRDRPWTFLEAVGMFLLLCALVGGTYWAAIEPLAP